MLRYSDHAEDRLTERKITKEEVESVVKDANVTYPDVKGNRCFVREHEGRTIRVVTAKDDPDFVITVIDVGN